MSTPIRPSSEQEEAMKALSAIGKILARQDAPRRTNGQRNRETMPASRGKANSQHHGRIFQRAYEETQRLSRRERAASKGNSRIDFPLGATYYPLARFNKDLQLSLLQEDEIVLPFFYDYVVTSTAGSIVTEVVSNNPSVVPGWSGIDATWDEYRVLNMRVEWVPYIPTGGNTVTFTGDVVSVVDRDNATALTGFSNAQTFGSYMDVSGLKTFHRDVPLSNTGEDNGFIDTLAASANGWVKFYGGPFPVSTAIARLKQTFLVQLRGRGT